MRKIILTFILTNLRKFMIELKDFKRKMIVCTVSKKVYF